VDGRGLGKKEKEEAGCRACFFAFLACLNEIVWRNFSESFWISFKLWGIMPLTMIFALAQLGVLKRHAVQEAR